MKNKDCKIVQDLLPNYIENLTTTETNEFINKHIEECEDCKKTLEILKENNIEPKEDNKIEIDYAKKVKRKLNILKLFWIIVLIILVLYAGSIVRNYCILENLEKLGSEYANSTNYKCVYTDVEGLNVHIVEMLVKDNIFIRDEISSVDLNEKSIWHNIDYNDYENNDFVNATTVDFTSRNERYEFYLDSEDSGSAGKPVIFSHFWKLFGITNLDLSFKSQITKEKIDGIWCYVIEYSNCKYYFEKDTGLFQKYSSNSEERIYSYKFNCLNDNMLKKPDVSNMRYVEDGDYSFLK